MSVNLSRLNIPWYFSLPSWAVSQFRKMTENLHSPSFYDVSEDVTSPVADVSWQPDCRAGNRHLPSIGSPHPWIVKADKRSILRGTKNIYLMRAFRGIFVLSTFFRHWKWWKIGFPDSMSCLKPWHLCLFYFKDF